MQIEQTNMTAYMLNPNYKWDLPTAYVVLIHSWS